MTKLEATRRQFQDTITRLDEVLRQPKSDITRDSAIKRFELAFDVGWKTIKALLEEEGVACVSPLGCFKEAFHQGLIEFDDVWVNLTKTRNQTVHTYEERLAEEVYASLPQALEAFKTLMAAIDHHAQGIAR